MTLAEYVNLEIFVMAEDEWSGAVIKAVCTERRIDVCQEDCQGKGKGTF